MTLPLDYLKVAFLSADGVEQIELEAPLNAIRQAGATACIVSIDAGAIGSVESDTSGDSFAVDFLARDIEARDFSALVIPGGARSLDARSRLDREVESVAIAVARDIEIAAERPKTDLSPCRFQELHQHVRGAERRMSAKIDFADGRKPAEMISVIIADEVRRLSEVILCCNRLKNAVVEPLLERTDGGRISAEEARTEGVYLVEGDFHPPSLTGVTYWTRARFFSLWTSSSKMASTCLRYV